MKYKKLLVLGASGGIGKWVVEMGQERGYEITVVVRKKASMDKFQNINIIQGNVLDSDVLKQAVEGQDFIISCLGIKRESQSNPWSTIASPSDFTEMMTRKALPFIKEQKIKRFIAVSAAGVGDSWGSVSWPMKFLIKKSNVKIAFSDFDKMENILHESDIESLSVRPVGLIDKTPSNKAKIVNEFSMSSRISKSDVAIWMLDALERKDSFSTPTEMIGW